MKKLFFFLSVGTLSLNAIVCDSFGDFKEYNGHYYAYISEKVTYDEAKNIAINNGGYLTIPETTGENEFISSLIGGNNFAWIGIYDPNYMENYCYDSINCGFGDTRFKTIKNTSLTYENWASYQPDNYVDAYDIVNGRNTVSPLGEHWVAISGNNAKWYDFGNHNKDFNNPVKYRAIIEFDTKPTCYLEDDVNSDLPSELVCNTKIFDSSIDTVTQGETYQCLSDSYGNDYCPQALAPASSYFDYENGYSVAHTGTVLDKATGTYAQHTGTVRDYANGTSQANTSTTTNYSNGTSASYTGSVVDYVDKTTTTIDASYGATAQYNIVLDWNDGTRCSGSGTISFGYKALNESITLCTYYANTCNSNPPCITMSTIPVSNTRVSIGMAGNSDCSMESSTSYRINKCSPQYSCPNGGTLSGTTCVKTTTSSICPTNYTDNGSNCKKTVNYNYYSYGCPSGYSPTNSGFSTYTKTDPDTTANNEATLDDAVNSSTPPVNNCVQTLTATAYQYICGTGYTPINAGLTSCPVGTNGACNSSTSPTSNCWKDISYKYYSYGCDSGYSTLNYGLSSCSKTDQNNQQNNEATLDDDCNSATPPVGNCSKSINYTYYEYLCSNSTNAQGNNFTANDSGLTTYTKTDTNTTTDNSTSLDDTVNSSTPPANNCQRQGFSCNSDIRTPVYVNNQWQCSPFPCLGESNFENLDGSLGSQDKDNNGWSENGDCTGEIYIFNGKSNQCRASDKLLGLSGGGCCDKDKVALGLVACKSEEKLLAKRRQKDFCHYVGNYCSKKVKLGFIKVCVQTSDSYCCFNSKLARIMIEQGRLQLKDSITWGSSDNPNCRGFTPDEFAKIDFSKVDLSEFVEDVQNNITDTVSNNISNYIKDKVTNFYQK